VKKSSPRFVLIGNIPERGPLDRDLAEVRLADDLERDLVAVGVDRFEPSRDVMFE
jgi:hypothetical protein